ncbi:MAG: hypothetical protein C0467_17290 [Planctomycetaceae bacterium]|nr:hypothetical protein [Planctomycetaceae bacterium]
MLPQRPSGGYAAQGPKSGILSSGGTTQSFEVVKIKVLAKLEDRMDPSTSKRMPVSLLRQSLRTYAEQIADQEGRGMPKLDRERLVDEVLAELLGYGPLEELFNDPAVREVMVVGPHAVIVRRDQGGWIPSHVRFRDDDHLNAALDRLATHADPVGGITTSVSTFDLKLPNGFRAIAILPPPALGAAATVAFIRVEAASAVAAAPSSSASSTNLPRTAATAASGSITNPARAVPPPQASSPVGSGSTSSGVRPPSDSPATAPPRRGSDVIANPQARTVDSADALTRHRNRIIERLISKLASLGVYDLHRVEIAEMRKVVAAYVSEYVLAEKIFLSDTDQSRLILEILTAMQR